MLRFKLTLGAFVLVAAVAMADDRPLDVTIKVVDSPADLPAAVTKTIVLPPSASDTARGRAQHGLDTANQVRAANQVRTPNPLDTTNQARSANQARTLAREVEQSLAERSKAKRPNLP
jgi:hypothetical protein